MSIYGDSMLRVLLYGILFVLCCWSEAFAVRVKDIASFSGIRDNQLIGYGLVVGLNGTGDKKDSIFTMSSMANMLSAMGISVDASQLKPKNVAAVMVTVSMPVSAKAGTKLDVTVSSIGDASSIGGGILLMTPLKGVDGEVYALAQGNIVISGFSVEGGGASVQKNNATVGSIPGGALIEKSIPYKFNNQKELTLHLTTKEPSTAMKIVDAINSQFKESAKATDVSTITIAIPEEYQGNSIPLLAVLENIEIAESSNARIVIDERSGTIVMGNDVRLAPVAVAHGNLQIVIAQNSDVSQPNSFGEGETVVTNETSIGVQETGSKLILMNGASLRQLVDGLNSIGVLPRDLISILRALKRSGSLYADIEVI